MKRSSVVHLGLLTSVAAMLMSCQQKATRYCVDGNNAVVADTNCEQKDSPGFVPFHWYYLHSRSGPAAAGTVLTGGSTETPSEGFATPSETARGVIGGAGEEAAGAHGFGEGAGE